MLSGEDLLQQAKDAEMELQDGKNVSRKNPLSLIIGLFLALLVVLILPAMYFGGSSEPHNIPSLSEVQGFISADDYGAIQGRDTKNYLAQLDPSNPAIKNIAAKIAVESCETNDRVCHAKAMFYFVRDNIEYVSDPPDEYLEHPLETLLTGGADCDGHAILLANLLQAIGVYTRFVFVPQHSYVQALLPEAPSRYKDNGNWIHLDPTCTSCKFGEIPRQYKNVKKRYSP